MSDDILIEPCDNCGEDYIDGVGCKACGRHYEGKVESAKVPVAFRLDPELVERMNTKAVMMTEELGFKVTRTDVVHAALRQYLGFPSPRDGRLATRVDNLELSVRSIKCLRYLNITYVYELVEWTEWELLATTVPGTSSTGNRKFSRKVLNEIKEILADADLTLSGRPPTPR